MSRELFASGYCRQIDASRMVEAEINGGEVEYADCLYGSCQFQSQCTIAQRIDEELEK